MKIALVGCGFFALNHLHAWSDIDGAEVVALCDVNPERLTQVGDQFGIGRRYASAEEMFSEGGFDAVDIATTVETHRALVEMSARHMVHAICQKPFASNMVDARAMVDAFEKSGKILMVHENFRWQSAVRRVIDELRAGSIGTPFFGRASFRSGYDVFSGQPYLAEGERFIIEDLGIHILDIARALFGDVTRLAATTRRVNQNIRGEDVATMLLVHSNDITSIVDCSYATRREPETFPESLIEIDGDAGTLRLDAGYQLSLQSEAGTQVHDLSPPVLPWASRPWHNIQESVLTIQKHFIDCVSARTEPETSGADNLSTLALVEAAYLSAAEGRMVDLAQI